MSDHGEIEALPCPSPHWQRQEHFGVGLFRPMPTSEPWTQDIRVYDLRTNKRFTLMERPLRSADMADFIACARLAERGTRQESERFKRYTYAELAARERLDLNLSWIREEGATDPASLPPPGEIAASIAEELGVALARFRGGAAKLG